MEILISHREEEDLDDETKADIIAILYKAGYRYDDWFFDGCDMITIFKEKMINRDMLKTEQTFESMKEEALEAIKNKEDVECW